MKKTYSSIDIAKFCACILIVLLHAKALKPYLSPNCYFMVEKSILRMAVPFFFVTSGYFLGRKLLTRGINNASMVIKNYCIRLLYPLVLFSIVNIAEHLIVFLWNGDPLFEICLQVAKHIAFYPYGALWFTQSCIVAAILLIPFINKGAMELAIFIGSLLYLSALIFNSYYFLIVGTTLQNLVDVTLVMIPSLRNGIFVGFVFMAIGVKMGLRCVISKNRKRIVGGGDFDLLITSRGT